MTAGHPVLFWSTLVVLVAAFIQHTETTNPGVRLRISERGLNYAANTAMQNLKSKLAGQRIPDISKGGSLSYSATSINIRSLQFPNSKIAASTSSLNWALTGMAVSVHGNWRVQYKKGWFRIRESGSFDASVSGVDLRISVRLGKDGNGRPTVTPSSCSANVRSVSVRFHGRLLAWIANRFRGTIESKVKDKLRGMICEKAKEAIRDSNDDLRTLKVSVPVAKDYMLDYRLVQNPTHGNNYLETSHKGQITVKGDTSVPFAPPPMTCRPGTSKMVYIMLSDHVINSWMYSAYKHNKLTFKLYRTSVPLFVSSQRVEIDIRANVKPTVDFQNGMMVVNATGDVVLDAAASGDAPNLRLNVHLNALVKLTVSIQGNQLKAQVSSIQLASDKTRIQSSDGSSLTNSGLIDFLNVILNTSVKEKINEYGRAGIELPTMRKVRYVNAGLTFCKDTLMLATDVHWTP